MNIKSFFKKKHSSRIQLFCVGTPKSGTHSFAAMFNSKLKSSHEPEGQDLIKVILNYSKGELTESELKSYLKNRDTRLRLEIDSSHLNIFIIKQLVLLFPKAKFVLTIRAPYSWLDSFINDALSNDVKGLWHEYRDLRFKPTLYNHPNEEQVLKEKGLYTLDGYLSYWTFHNQTIIDTVPKRQLLIVKTSELKDNATAICNFAGINPALLNKDKIHAYKAKKKHQILDQLDKDYLKNKISQHCGKLTSIYF